MSADSTIDDPRTGPEPTASRSGTLQSKLAGLSARRGYDRLNIVVTLFAVFTLPVAGLLAHVGGAEDVADWTAIGLGIEAAATLFFLFDIAVGFASQGRAYALTSAFTINVLACGGMAFELLAGHLGIANPRVLRVLRTIRAVAKAGLLVRGTTMDSVLGAEALRRMNEQDAWYALMLLILLSFLGHFSIGVYDTAADALIEIAVYVGFILAVRWKASRNRAQVEAVFISRLRDANRRVLERMQEIPGLEDADTLVRGRAEEYERQGRTLTEIELMVESIGMIMGNLRRFISRRTFAEAKGEIVLAPDRPVALMFTDVEGFSRITEAMRQQVIPVLQRYLGDMGQGVARFNGDVDKFIGDAVFAYFDDVENPANSANLCFDAALAMQQHCRLLGEANEEWARLFNGEEEWQEFRHFRTRFGLHLGHVVAGPIGDEHRADSTLIGDDVNLSARLEGLSKKYGCYFLMSDMFHDCLSPDRQAQCRRVDRVTVAGREDTPLDIYTVEEERKPDAYYDLYDEALALYLDGDWQSAHETFDRAQSALTDAGRPECPVARAMMNRIETNRMFWFKAVDHMHERAPDVVDETLKAKLIAKRQALPFIAPVSWPGFWRHEK